ncbi:MAG TPA: hypothetical protein VF824_21200 [Thermoanaerobaculia bacterium]|jgi:hypothetical protein
MRSLAILLLLADHADATMTVGCWTCHRGKPQPEAPPAAPAEPEHH